MEKCLTQVILIIGCCFRFPMIETVLVEVPSEDHPFGVRGVGETPICPPVPAISNAVNDAIGTRILSTPIKASKILNTLKSM